MTISKERIILYLLAAAQFTHIVDFMIVMPLGPQLMRLFEINPQQFGMIVSSYTISAGIVGFFGAFLIDKFDRKKALLVVYIGLTLGTLACATANDYYFLIITRCLTGAFGGIQSALVLSIIGDVFPESRRGSATGIVMASFSLAAVLGVPLGLFLATQFTWHTPFYMLGGLGIIISILILLLIPNMKQHIEIGSPKPNPLSILTNIWQDKNQLRAPITMFFLIIGQFSVIPFISPYYVSNVGITEIQLTLVYLLGGGATMFTAPIIGRLSDKYGKPTAFTIIGLLSTAPLLLTTHLGSVHIIIALIVSTSFFILISGRMIPFMAMITSVVKPNQRGGFMSINFSVQQLSAGLASLVSGVIITEANTGELLNYNYVGYLAIATSLIAIFLGRKIKSIQ